MDGVTYQKILAATRWFTFSTFCFPRVLVLAAPVRKRSLPLVIILICSMTLFSPSPGLAAEWRQ